MTYLNNPMMPTELKGLPAACMNMLLGFVATLWLCEFKILTAFFHISTQQGVPQIATEALPAFQPW